MEHKFIFLNLNGIPSEMPSKNESVYLCYDPQGIWVPNKEDIRYEIDGLCAEIHNAFAERIFENLDIYYKQSEKLPYFVFEAGLNSESKMSRIDFQKSLEKSGNNILINQALYLFDCRKLVSGIQECSKEIVYLQGEFYRILNLESFFLIQVLNQMVFDGHLHQLLLVSILFLVLFLFGYIAFLTI